MQSFCRTCFIQISDTSSLGSFDYKSRKHQLVVCVPEMNLQVVPNGKLCKECIVALNITYKFKMKCREVEDQMNKEEFSVIERSMFTKDTHFSNNIICRTCLGDIINNDNVLLAEKSYKSKLMLCVPEMDLKVTSDINLCNNCHDLLDKIYTFKRKCLDVEENIKGYLKLHNKVDVRELLVWCNVFVKYEVGLAEDYTIKQEEIDLVSEDEIIDVKGQITNNIQKTEQLKTRECIKNTSKYRRYKCNNVEHLVSNKSKSNSKHSKSDYNIAKESHLREGIHPHIDGKPFKCLLCSYSTVHKSHLKIHIRIHTGEKPFKCSLCNYTTAYKFTLNQHTRTHTGEKPFKCLLCNYSTAQKSDLKIHIRIHTGEKPFKCSLCNYTAARKTTLDKHAHIHSGEKPFKCSLCEYSATQKSHLRKHICTHTGEKPFKCTLCEYSAVDKYNLITHIRTHTSEKLFKCLLCNYSAARKSHVEIHMRTHTGEKPFKCSLCGYSTVDNSTLKKHIRIHTGEKPFKCSLCKYSATQKGTLNVHIRTHIGEKS